MKHPVAFLSAMSTVVAGTACMQVLAAAPPKAAEAKPAVAATVAANDETDPITARALSSGVANPGRRVLAMYYAWYGTQEKSGKWSHQNGVDIPAKSIADHAHFPTSGPYDSADPAVVDRHLQQAKAAGIDTLVCSWWEREDGCDKALQAMAKKASSGVTVCAYVEQLSREHSVRAAMNDLSYLLDTAAKEPGYLKVNGKPVIFLFSHACESLTLDDWADVLNQLNRKYAPGVIVIGEGGGQTDLLVWDGLYTLGETLGMAGKTPVAAAQSQHEVFRTPVILGKRAGRITIVSLAPGYDDRKANMLAGRMTGLTMVDRASGRLYTECWEQAIKDKPDWVLVNSFNQWHNGTEIEPSTEFGDQFITLTHQYAERFKSTATAAK